MQFAAIIINIILQSRYVLSVVEFRADFGGRGGVEVKI